ncbi:type I restriction enzyme, S subunit [Pseudomonas sp. IT-93MI4]|uniref:restriction endonuclease subunit S n=1 Tax=Pseudomonas sp. IT-93MI4 TaxID=3026441 RepID=UPI0039DF6B48
MTFPVYPDYRDSGVEWLGAVPVHWDIKPLRYLGRFRKGLTITKADLTDTGIPCLNYGEVHSLYPFEVNQDIQVLKCVPAEYLDTEPSSCISYGDFVFADTSEDLEGVGNFTHVSGLDPLFAGYHTIIYSLDSDVNSRFLAYCLESFAFRTQLRMGVKGVKVFSVTQEILRGGIAWLPTTGEQTQIALFLDHETARIDALVEEQHRLIELLKEKRQALISHAVTKGLDPTVPMKDSGVEWLGEVPAHWGVKALRYLGECQNGINIGGEAFGSGSPFVSYGDVYKNAVLPSEVTGLVQSSPEDQRRYSIEYGDVFFTRTSETVDEIGFSATCLQELPSAVFAGFLIRFRPTGKSLSPGFSKYYFRNQRLRIFFNKEMNLVTRASLSQDLLKLLPVTIPPVVEQIKISDYLDRVTAEFGSLLGQAIKAIDLLKERRSALISAAVTGKIDVRGWQPLALAQSPELEEEAV